MGQEMQAHDELSGFESDAVLWIKSGATTIGRVGLVGKGPVDTPSSSGG
jgi:hypothetical protein